MPVTDLTGDGGDDNEWLQQYLAGHMAAQAYGASQPYGPGGAPGPYSGGSQGLMPGGGVMARQQATPGAPSMGYPAMGRAPAPGMNLSGNPPAAQPGLMSRFLNAINPISSAEAAPLNMGGGDIAPSGARFKLNPTPSAVVTGQGDQPPPTPRFDPRMGSSVTMNAPPQSGSGYGDPRLWGGPPATKTPPARPVTPSPATAYPATTAAPAAARPPAATTTAAPAPTNWMIDRPNMSASGWNPGSPKMTALDLSSLFNHPAAQAAAANPANVPAPNAQTVSGALGPNGMSNAPGGFGPLQKGMHWPYGPSAKDWAAASLKQRYG